MPPDRYNARESEPRWQKAWDDQGIFATANDDPRPKYYVLEMFPYPSGRIHIGHVGNCTMGGAAPQRARALVTSTLTKRALLGRALNWEVEDSSAREGNCQSDLDFSSNQIGFRG
jgi:hypothetical protein